MLATRTTIIGGDSITSGINKSSLSLTLSSASIDRSSEFLSCAKTAVKVAKSQYLKKKKKERQLQQRLLNDSDNGDDADDADEDDLLLRENSGDPNLWFVSLDANAMTLHSPTNDAQSDMSYNVAGTNSMKSVLHQGCTLLEEMELKVVELDGLVRRRGQSNDPTNEITILVSQLESIASTLSVLIQTQMVPIRIYGQKAEHYKQIQLWFQNRAQQYSQRLKDILAIRATVVAEQAKRRRRFVAPTAAPAPAATTTTISSSALTTTNNTKSSKAPETTMASVKSYYQSDNPLFSPNPIVIPPKQQQQQRQSTSLPSSHHNSILDNGDVLNTNNNSTPVPNNSIGAVSGTSTKQYEDSTRSHVDATQKNQSVSSTIITDSYYGRNNNGVSANSAVGYGGATTRSTHSYYYGNKALDSSTTAVENNSSAGTMGIRRRGAVNGGRSGNGSSNDDKDNNYYQAQSQQQQQQQTFLIERQTASRLREARMAEKSLAELGTVFGKMSTLIMQQSETITKIEDDVEAAQIDVSDGQNEITILYQLKKGNRMLIIKTYSLLIFLIVFMRLYASPKR